MDGSCEPSSPPQYHAPPRAAAHRGERVDGLVHDGNDVPLPAVRGVDLDLTRDPCRTVAALLRHLKI